MNRLLFFILMPIIFEFIMFLIYHFSNDWTDNIKREAKIFSVLLIIDYIIEFIYLKIVRNILGVWIFSKEFNNVETYESYSNFVVLSIIYIIATIVLSLVTCKICSDNELPIMHTIVLIILFAVFCGFQTSYIHESQDDNAFNSIGYQTEENTIYLRAMGDGRETSGDIQGRSHPGTGYIQGKIETNYNLYYAFIDENGKTIIRSIPYNENNVNIYEIGDEGDPRIVFHKYYKSYSCESAHDKYDEYYIYDIFIPSISSSVNIDMQ